MNYLIGILLFAVAIAIVFGLVWCIGKIMSILNISTGEPDDKNFISLCLEGMVGLLCLAGAMIIITICGYIGEEFFKIIK